MPYTIAHAIPILDELANTLDKAYWEASSIATKDATYDCFSTVSKELLEINKLSIQDHDLTYEPISYEFKLMSKRLTIFRKSLDHYIMRNTTFEALDNVITSTIQLISQEVAQSLE
ncbi:MAG: hypothetical protein ACI8VC_001689 [Candidatus Endobugula sp.]|jgi:hypothetical protein